MLVHRSEHLGIHASFPLLIFAALKYPDSPA